MIIVQLLCAVKIHTTLSLLLRNDRKKLFLKALDNPSHTDLFVIYENPYTIIPRLEYAILTENIWAITSILVKYNQICIFIVPVSSSRVIIKTHTQGITFLVNNDLKITDLEIVKKDGQIIYDVINKKYPGLPYQHLNTITYRKTAFKESPCRNDKGSLLFHKKATTSLFSAGFTSKLCCDIPSTHFTIS